MTRSLRVWPQIASHLEGHLIPIISLALWPMVSTVAKGGGFESPPRGSSVWSLQVLPPSAWLHSVSLTRFLAEVYALLLSDVVVLLQEKDQKLVFAAVVSFLPTDVLAIALLLHLVLFQSRGPLTFLTLSRTHTPRTTNHRSFPLRGYWSGKWLMRTKPCFSSTRVPPACRKCMRFTPAPERNASPGWR